MSIIEITKEMREKSNVLARQIFAKEKRIGWKDKFKTRYELASDYVGFLGEMAFAKIYNLPEPEFLVQGRDKYDWIIKGKRVDLKTKAEKTKDFLVNQGQFERKKDLIDVFVFGEIYGNYFRAIGWVGYDELPEISKLVIFPNGSKAYSVHTKLLKKTGDLFV